MVSKSKIIIFYIFILTNLFSLNIAIFYENIESFNNENDPYIILFINEIEIKTMNEDVAFKLIREKINILDKKELSDICTINNCDLYIILSNIKNSVKLDIFEKKGNLISTNNINNVLPNENEIIENYKERVADKIISKLIEKKDLYKQYVPVIDLSDVLIKNKIKFNFEFPNINVGLSAISYKLFNDQRVNLFSVYPINISILFYPLKKIEIGGFFKFSYDTSIFLYRNINSGQLSEKKINFDFEYGFMIGYCSVFENTLYSIGFSFYNKVHVLDNNDTYKSKNDVFNYFLPQFSFYQKFSFKLFKNIYYSAFINIKTSQIYEYSEPYFYGNVFDYNALLLEICPVGVSIIF